MMTQHHDPHKTLMFRKDQSGDLWVLLPGEIGTTYRDCYDMAVLASTEYTNPTYINCAFMAQTTIVHDVVEVDTCYRMAWMGMNAPGAVLPDGMTFKEAVEKEGYHLKRAYLKEYWLGVRRNRYANRPKVDGGAA